MLAAHTATRPKEKVGYQRENLSERVKKNQTLTELNTSDEVKQLHAKALKLKVFSL